MDTLLKTIKYIRAIATRSLKTRQSYLAQESIRPISTKYGFDRGLPVDRYYIEKFLKSHQPSIRGAVLEVVDSTYTEKFGGDKVSKADALDIFLTLKANIHGDLRNLSGVIADETYDCIIVTQTFNVIDQYEKAIGECYRILKPGGVLLVTLPTLSPTWNLKINMWRFTAPAAKETFSQFFNVAHVDVASLGNRESALAFWLGMAVEDLAPADIKKNDETLPLIIGIAATK